MSARIDRDALLSMEVNEPAHGQQLTAFRIRRPYDRMTSLVLVDSNQLRTRKSRDMRSFLEIQLDWLFSRAPDGLPDNAVHAETRFVTIGAVARDLHIKIDGRTARKEAVIRSWLEKHGWQYGRRSRGISGTQPWGYRRPNPEFTRQSTGSTPDVPVLAERLHTPEPTSPAATPHQESHLRRSARPTPPRAVRHAQSLLRLFGFHSTWTPSNADRGASLVIHRAPRAEARS